MRILTGQLPFDLAPEELSNAEADFIDFVLSNPDLLFNNIDSETTPEEQTTSKPPMTTPKSPETPDQTVTDPHTKTGQTDTGHVGETPGNTDSGHGLVVENGVVRDPATGIITHVMDIHDGELLEVVQSEITGGHVIDPHTGEFILLSEISTMIGNTPESVTPVTAVTLLSWNSTTASTPQPTTTSETGATSKNKIINGVIRHPATGQITHVVDPHDGAHLEVSISPIFGAHVFDPHTGDLIIAEDHAMEFGTVDVQPKTSTEAPQQVTTTSEVIKTITETITTKPTTTATEATTTTIETITKAITPIVEAATTTTEAVTTTTEASVAITEAPATTREVTATETTTNAILPEVPTPEASTPAPMENTTMSAANQDTTTESHQLGTEHTQEDHLHDHDIYVNKFIPSPSGSGSEEKQKSSTGRRKFGSMKGISSVLDKYKSEYLKRRKGGNANDTDVPNINTVLKWIERRKNTFKKYLQEKKHVEEEKKQNPRKSFQVLDLESYFPSLQRNKFGGLEARKKWMPAGTTSASTLSSAGGGSGANNPSSGSNEGRANSNRLQNPFLQRNNGADKTKNQPNTDRRNRFQVLMARKLENQRKQAVKNTKQETTTPIVQPTEEATTPEMANEKPQTDTVNKGKRRKFNNFFRNRKLLSKSSDSQNNVNKNENTEGSVADYLNSLKSKVTENTNVSGKNNQTPERYVAGLARKINNQIVARNPDNVKLRKDKWDKSYLADQPRI